jgi:hypothetical protein
MGVIAATALALARAWVRSQGALGHALVGVSHPVIAWGLLTRSLAGLQAIDRSISVDYLDRGSQDPLWLAPDNRVGMSAPDTAPETATQRPSDVGSLR